MEKSARMESQRPILTQMITGLKLLPNPPSNREGIRKPPKQAMASEAAIKPPKYRMLLHWG
jgi:hypothetical protein